MHDFDVIIVGAGHNGLTCACYLSIAGWRVAVLEGASEIGGGLRSDVATLPGFVHDRYATNLSLFASSPAYLGLKADLDEVGVKFLSTDKPFASAHNNRSVRISTNVAETANSLGKLNPSDEEGWNALVAFFKRISPSVFPFFNEEMPSSAMLKMLSGMLVRSRPADLWQLLKLIGQSSTAFAREFFDSPDAVSIFQAWAYHLDFPPNKRGGALFSFVSAMSTHVYGMKLAEGGAGKVSAGLRSLIERSGGVVITNAEVTEITVHNSRAVGVKLRDGQAMTARRAVVANVTTRNLFGKLVDPSNLPNGFLRRAKNFEYGPGTFIIHLALSRAPTWKAGSDLKDFSYVHLNASEAEIQATHESSARGELPARPLLVVSQTTQIDPSRAPAGHHVMRIHVRTVPAEIRGGASGEINARDWKGAKEPFTERILDLVAEAAPDIRDCVIGMKVETPQEIEQENPNFVGGDCVSGSHRITQNFFLRPFIGWSNYNTPVEGLFMIGASTWPGGGVNGASGYLVAQKLIKAPSPT